jgi:hypothetical protein
MTTRADWLVSSRSWTTQTITINASVQNVAASLGGLYLLHTVAALSAIHQLYLALVAAGVTSPAVTITRSRKVKISASGTFSITWGSGTTLRDLLGFTGNLSGAASYVAPLRSTLLWSGAKHAEPTEAPIDATGSPRVDGSAVIGPTGVQTVLQEGDPTITETYRWRRVIKSRFWADPLTGPRAGDWRYFWGAEAITSQRIGVLRKVTEGDDDDDADADYSASYVLGPYVTNMSGRDAWNFKMVRSIPTVDRFFELEWSAIVCEEFSA